MEIQTLIKEIKLFFKEHLKTITICTVIIVVLGMALQIGLYSLNKGSQENGNKGDNLTHTASFRIYIEQENIGVFTNSYLIEEYLKQENVVKEIEKTTNVSFLPILDEYSETNEIITTTEEDPVNASRDTSTNIFTISIGVGSETDNLKVAQAYYDWLKETEFKFFDDKTIYYISAPTTIESVIAEQENAPSTKVLTIRLVLILLGGIVFGIVVSLLKTLLSKKIKYAFVYSWDEKDIFLRYTKENKPKEIIQGIVHPYYEQKVILSEQKMDENIEKAINHSENIENLLNVSDITDIDPKLEIDEVIIIIYRKQTSKQWYRDQRNQLKNYPDTEIKIIQL